MIGWFGEDVADAVGGAVDTVTDVGSSVIDTVPGARDLANVVDAVVTGPVRDFANTAAGRTLLTALAGSLTGGLAAIVGPQLATVAFALPGLAAGDDFATAWSQEFGRRVEELIKYFAGDVGEQASAAVSAEIRRATEYMKQAGIDPGQITLQALAKAAGVSDWSAAMVLDGLRGYAKDTLRAFDLVSGRLVVDETRLAKDAIDLKARPGSLTEMRAALALAATPRTSVRDTPLSRSGYQVVSAPTPTAVRAPRPADAPKTGMLGNVALGLTIAAAVGAVYWWKSS